MRSTVNIYVGLVLKADAPYITASSLDPAHHNQLPGPGKVLFSKITVIGVEFSIVRSSYQWFE